MTQRAQGALEGLLMGAVIGAQGGPIGAAIGAGTMLIVGALTGRTPFGMGGGGMGGGPYDPDPVEAEREAEIEEELEREVARGDVLEDEIEAELRRQEELLQQIDQQEKTQASANAAISETLTGEELAARADPRSAPEAPKDRELPLSIFDESRATIAKQTWENERELVVVKRSLDADRDGKAEEVRYFDEESGELVRKEQDRDYDGRPDAWSVPEEPDRLPRSAARRQRSIAGSYARRMWADRSRRGRQTPLATRATRSSKRRTTPTTTARPTSW
jgi:hypothetical protein